MIDERRESWNRVYERGDLDALSGSIPEETIRQHDLDPMPPAPRTILDVGVGTGGAARFYRETLGYTVDALDVADRAEAKARPWIRNFYLHSALTDLPAKTYDYAVSHLVAQHMAEPDLKRQAKAVARALKPGGIFSLHLAGSRIEGENNWIRPDIPEGFDGRMCRDPDYAVEMLQRTVGVKYKVSATGKIMEWPAFRSFWFFVHVRRGES